MNAAHTTLDMQVMAQVSQIYYCNYDFSLFGDSTDVLPFYIEIPYTDPCLSHNFGKTSIFVNNSFFKPSMTQNQACN